MTEYHAAVTHSNRLLGGFIDAVRVLIMVKEETEQVVYWGGSMFAKCDVRLFSVCNIHLNGMQTQLQG